MYDQNERQQYSYPLMKSLPKFHLCGKTQHLVKHYIKLTNHIFVSSLHRSIKDTTGKCHHVCFQETLDQVGQPKIDTSG